MQDITFCALPISTVLPEAEALSRDHWREFYGETPYRANIPAIVDLENHGNFAYVAGRNEAGEIVAHAGFMVFYSPFHDERVAMDMFYFVRPDARAGWTATKLLKFAGQCIRGAGVGVILASAMTGSQLGPLIKRAGYEPASEMFRFTGA